MLSVCTLSVRPSVYVYVIFSILYKFFPLISFLSFIGDIHDYYDSELDSDLEGEEDDSEDEEDYSEDEGAVGGQWIYYFWLSTTTKISQNFSRVFYLAKKRSIKQDTGPLNTTSLIKSN